MYNKEEMKIEEFRIVETVKGFVVERLTEFKEFTYTHSFLGIGIYGKTVIKNEYLPIDLWGNGCRSISWMDKHLKQEPYTKKETAVSRIHYLVNEYNRKANHVDKYYYPPFDEQK